MSTNKSKNKEVRNNEEDTQKEESIAYSYTRFSTPGQEDGDSVDRQIRLRDAWLKRHPKVKLDTNLKLIDKGVSGYTGSNRKNSKHALAKFLELVERGRIPEGSFLIVENLDRLTRESPVVSIPIVLTLIGAGIRVVQLAPVEVVYDADMEQHHLMNMLWELARGHGESKRKSGMCGEAWGAKKDLARKDKIPYGAMCPAWLEIVGVKILSSGRKDFSQSSYRLKADAALAIQKIFRWCAEGLGTFGILERLNKEGVPPIGRIQRWESSYVKKLLNSRSVLGEYQPRKGSRGPNHLPDGEPIPNFYPAAIEESLWYAAHNAMKARTRKSGRTPTATNNPFSGLLWDAVTRSKLHISATNGPAYKYLVASAALQKTNGVTWRTFPLKTFTLALLEQMSELQASSLFSDPNANRLTVLEGRLADVEKRLAVAITQFEADPESPTWAAKVNQYDKEKRAIAKEIKEAESEVQHPLTAAWTEAVSLMHQNDPLRLRAALLETIESIWCLFVSHGSIRLAQVQVLFKNSDGAPSARRDYFIIHRPATGGFVGSRPARYYAHSLRLEQPEKYQEGDQIELFDIGDISDPMIRGRRLRELENMPQKVIDEILAEHGQDIA